ncbi:hypothetical protein CFP56_015811 [Quercus suber]|uniref:S-locus receptor kinase C-terminal domain-containing protein n=1 Tax=Quercus suber TaxID=58331 RepID=A0AAW0KQH9_QUESU
MSEVVTMLSNESVALPCPKQPGFLNVGTVVKENQINSMTEICSVNDASISIVQGRSWAIQKSHSFWPIQRTSLKELDQ